jgi:hypothetical protein
MRSILFNFLFKILWPSWFLAVSILYAGTTAAMDEVAPKNQTGLPSDRSLQEGAPSSQEKEAPLRLKQNLVSQEVSGVVIGLRRKQGTEVLLKGIKEPVVIPFLSYHNKIFNRCLDSQKNAKPVSLRIDPRSRQVLDDAEEADKK